MMVASPVELLFDFKSRRTGDGRFRLVQPLRCHGTKGFLGCLTFQKKKKSNRQQSKNKTPQPPRPLSPPKKKATTNMANKAQRAAFVARATGCGSKNRNSKMGCPGKWKHGYQNQRFAPVIKFLILSHHSRFSLRRELRRGSGDVELGAERHGEAAPVAGSLPALAPRR